MLKVHSYRANLLLLPLNQTFKMCINILRGLWERGAGGPPVRVKTVYSLTQCVACVVKITTRYELCRAVLWLLTLCARTHQ